MSIFITKKLPNYRRQKKKLLKYCYIPFRISNEGYNFFIEKISISKFKFAKMWQRMLLILSLRWCYFKVCCQFVEYCRAWCVWRYKLKKLGVVKLVFALCRKLYRFWPTHSQEWPRHDFSWHCQCSINQTSDESIKISSKRLSTQHQILRTEITVY